MKLSALTPDTRNANKGTARGRKMVRESLQRYGTGRSILLDKSGNIIAGNKTVEGAMAVGLEDCQIVKSDGSKLIAVQRTDLDINDRKSRELAIADNRASELGLDWNLDVLKEFNVESVDLAPFWDSQELSGLLGIEPEEAPEPKLDQAAELQRKWGTELGQLWRIGPHRLLCGDAFGVDLGAKRLIGEQNADCVFTSPPYGVGIDYGTYQDTLENLRVLLPKLANLAMETVCPGGYAVINFGDIVSGGQIAGGSGPCEYPMALEYWPVFRAVGWRLWSRRVWCKPGGGASNFEHIWTWKKDGESIIDDQTTGEYASQNGWIDSTHGVNLGVGLETHGAGMPPMPAIFSVRNHSRPGHIVFEPFCGTATTMVACEQTNRACYALEIEPKYVAVALQRLSDMGLKPELSHA